jgi:hypothetical protein
VELGKGGDVATAVVMAGGRAMVVDLWWS